MMNNINPDNLSEEVMELLDLYVVGALDDNEIVQAKNILSVSSQAKSYVDEQIDKLSNLEMDSPSNPKLFESIKKEIAAKNDGNKINSNISEISAAPSIKKSSNNKLSYFAIAASVLAVLISVSLISTKPDNKTNSTASKKMDMKKDMELFSSEKTTQKMQLTSTSENISIDLMMNDKGMVMIDGRILDSLTDTETYQLWAIVADASPGSNGTKVISAAVLGSDPDILMTHVDGDVRGFAITREVSGGVVASNNEAMYAHMLA
jgi:hypothetical protein